MSSQATMAFLWRRHSAIFTPPKCAWRLVGRTTNTTLKHSSRSIGNCLNPYLNLHWRRRKAKAHWTCIVESDYSLCRWLDGFCEWSVWKAIPLRQDLHEATLTKRNLTTLR